MPEPKNIRLQESTMSSSTMGRAKSYDDIGRQYSRLYNRLYRDYINYDIDEATFRSRSNILTNAHDTYERNIAVMQGVRVSSRADIVLAMQRGGLNPRTRYTNVELMTGLKARKRKR